MHPFLLSIRMLRFLPFEASYVAVLSAPVSLAAPGTNTFMTKLSVYKTLFSFEYNLGLSASV